MRHASRDRGRRHDLPAALARVLIFPRPLILSLSKEWAGARGRGPRAERARESSVPVTTGWFCPFNSPR